MKRLLAYLKPHKWMMLLSALFVVALIGVELYKPIIIGNAIDNYISSYGQTGMGMEEAYRGILYAGGLYALMLLLGFAFNASNNWILQNVGQSIIYRMREEVFAHIHGLSVHFFNTQPVGKLVTRVSNDTEAVNELFSQILAKLFKNTVKIIGFAVVMLSINVKMALYSFLLLPFVTALTFLFRYLSRKAYRITRT
ncbi:MAG: ABC transporter ATP-binding protein, partial [Lachnospiraceae bacterium]|nr:ABC transporter ATP-binding protein [Lachnospiraceae bacterium]